MDFWKIVASSADRPLNLKQASTRLESALLDMPANDVLDFCAEFDRKMDEAYTWELWGIAYLINGGCSDDTFMDFRASLIALGQQTYEQALADPESLVALEDDELSELFEEGFGYCASNAYEQLTGEQAVTNVGFKASPSGEAWQETIESLQTRYPKAWPVYGWQASTPDDHPPTRQPWWKFW